MATKPASLPAWNTGGANNTEPSAGEKVSGWTVGQQPPSSYFNWWQKLTYEWTAYLDDLEAQAFTWTGLHTFQNNVSVAVTSANPALNASNAGANVAVNGLNTGTSHGVAGGAVDAAAFGGYFVNNTNTATALKGISTGTSSYGVHGEGKAAGVRGVGGAAGANGGKFEGNGSGDGLRADGGTSGRGGVFVGYGAVGVYASRSGSTALPVIDARGTIDFDGASYPSSSASVKDQCTVNSFVKAWGMIEITSATTCTTVAGVNLASVTYTNGTLLATYTDPMATLDGYLAMGNHDSTFTYQVSSVGRATTALTLIFNSIATPGTYPTSGFVNFIVMGAM